MPNPGPVPTGRQQAAVTPVIGVALQGDPLAPGAWSGTVAGLMNGLRDAGVEVAPVRAEWPVATRVSRKLGHEWSSRAASRSIAAASSLAARTALRRAGGVDGVVQIGSGYHLPRGVRFVTWEDMTVAQAARMPDGNYDLRAGALRRWQDRQARVYRRASACCVTSRWTADSLVDDYGVAPEKVHLVGFGRNAAPASPQRDWSTPRLLFVGREWERKNGPLVLRAFSRLHDEVPEARLDLVGGHPEIDAPGVTGHGTLRFGVAEEREKYAQLLATSTCFVMPSRYEPFGIAYLDAGAVGLPSIGTTVGGARDAIGEGGLLVRPDDEDGLLDAMRRLSDPATARELGTQARRNSDTFTWRQVAERIIRALRPPGVALDDLAPALPWQD